MSIVRRTEVRSTSNVTFDVTLLSFLGKGVEREAYLDLYGVNAGHPASLHLRSRTIDGVLSGKVKMTRLANTVGGVDYYSLRLIGSGRRRTVYLRGDVQVQVTQGKRSLADTVQTLWTALNMA